MSDCIFCKIVEGQLPASIVYEDDIALAFMDIMPINAGHVLVIPKQHFEQIHEMDETTGGHLFQIAMKIAKAIRKSDLPCEGINILQNNGKAAFQEVFHVHLHVIPRLFGDKLKLQIPHVKAHRAALDETATLIKNSLSAK